MNLRSKRLARKLSPEAAAFLDSTVEDAGLLADDVLGSLAHVQTLAEARLLTPTEAHELTTALIQLHAQATHGSFPLSSELEDVHMNVEAYLTQHLGDLGKKLHTARSRNDQVALDLRLAARRGSLALAQETLRLADTLLQRADEHGEALLPGHTHFQIAQPVTLGHQLRAHAERLARDLERLLDAYKRINVSPLGAGALAGTNHPIQPATTARLLGFDAAFNNSLDAVSDRDFVVELLFIETLLLTHLSGLAEELILFAHPSLGFVELPDEFATGSSLMPQKKNPDVLEVIRAKAGTLLGVLTASLAQLKALPLAYNRDLQEQKRLFLNHFPTGVESVRIVNQLIAQLKFRPEAMEAAAGDGYSDATDLADYLVDHGVPFRQAHEEAAQAVRLGLGKGVPLARLALSDLQSINRTIAKDVFDHLGPRASVAAKQSPGGTAPPASRSSQRALQRKLNQSQKAFQALAENLRKTQLQLLTPPQEVRRK